MGRQTSIPGYGAAERMPGLRYNDTLFRAVVCLPVAFFIVLFNIHVDELRLAATDPNFWIAVSASYLIALLLLWSINRISLRLDRKGYHWKLRPMDRVLRQLALGFLPAALAAFILAALYFRAIYGIHIFDTRYLTIDYPIVLLFLLFANAYYAFYFLWHYAAMMEAGHRDLSPADILYRDFFLADTPSGVQKVPCADIACFRRLGPYYQLCTFDRRVLVIEQSLNEIEPALDPTEFFRANRQYIVSHRICKNYRPFGHSGQLELSLDEPLGSRIVIGRPTTAAFLAWLKR